MKVLYVSNSNDIINKSKKTKKKIDSKRIYDYLKTLFPDISLFTFFDYKDKITTSRKVEDNRKSVYHSFFINNCTINTIIMLIYFILFFSFWQLKNFGKEKKVIIDINNRYILKTATFLCKLYCNHSCQVVYSRKSCINCSMLDSILSFNNYKETNIPVYDVKNIDSSDERKEITNLLDKSDSFNCALYYLLAFNLIISLIFYFFRLRGLLIFILSIQFLLVVINSIIHFKRYLPILFFFVSFFTFTMGQYYFSNITNYYFYYSNFDVQNTSFSILIQIISITFLFCGYDAIINYKKKILPRFRICDNAIAIINKFLIAATICTFICALAYGIEKVFYCFNHGYLSMYSSFRSIFPNIVYKLSNYFLSLTLISLVFCKEKKHKNTFLSFLVVYCILELLSGARFMIVYVALFILFYLIYNDHKILRNKKVIIYGLICIPIGIFMLSIFNNIRKNERININIVSELGSFFSLQGSSINVLTIAKVNETYLSNSSYVFGKYIETNLNRINSIFNTNYVFNKRIDLAFDVSTIVLGSDMVEEGHGLGSSYLAEVYIDYGVIGIIVFSFLLGGIIGFMYGYSKTNIFALMFLFVSFQSIIQISRGTTFSFISNFTSVFHWCIVLVIYMVNRCFIRKGVIS